MTREIDARGLPCPQPVINTKKALEEYEEEPVTVLVDSQESLENVRRFARSQGCLVETAGGEGNYRLTITRGCPVKTGNESTGDVFLIMGNQLGTGDERLGESLMIGFINNLLEAPVKPGKLIFLNSGVKLAVEGSGALETLKKLESAGVGILSCGTCLEYYQITERLGVGLVTNMYEVVNTLHSAGKVVRI